MQDFKFFKPGPINEIRPLPPVRLRLPLAFFTDIISLYSSSFHLSKQALRRQQAFLLEPKLFTVRAKWAYAWWFVQDAHLEKISRSQVNTLIFVLFVSQLPHTLIVLRYHRAEAHLRGTFSPLAYFASTEQVYQFDDGQIEALCKYNLFPDLAEKELKVNYDSLFDGATIRLEGKTAEEVEDNTEINFRANTGSVLERNRHPSMSSAPFGDHSHENQKDKQEDFDSKLIAIKKEPLYQYGIEVPFYNVGPGSTSRQVGRQAVSGAKEEDMTMMAFLSNASDSPVQGDEADETNLDSPFVQEMHKEYTSTQDSVQKAIPNMPAEAHQLAESLKKYHSKQHADGFKSLQSQSGFSALKLQVGYGAVRDIVNLRNNEEDNLESGQGGPLDMKAFSRLPASPSAKEKARIMATTRMPPGLALLDLDRDIELDADIGDLANVVDDFVDDWDDLYAYEQDPLSMASRDSKKVIQYPYINPFDPQIVDYLKQVAPKEKVDLIQRAIIKRMIREYPDRFKNVPSTDLLAATAYVFAHPKCATPMRSDEAESIRGVMGHLEEVKQTTPVPKKGPGNRMSDRNRWREVNKDVWQDYSPSIYRERSSPDSGDFQYLNSMEVGGLNQILTVDNAPNELTEVNFEELLDTPFEEMDELEKKLAETQENTGSLITLTAQEEGPDAVSETPKSAVGYKNGKLSIQEDEIVRLEKPQTNKSRLDALRMRALNRLPGTSPETDENPEMLLPLDRHNVSSLSVDPLVRLEDASGDTEWLESADGVSYGTDSPPWYSPNWWLQDVLKRSGRDNRSVESLEKEVQEVTDLLDELDEAGVSSDRLGRWAARTHTRRLDASSRRERLRRVKQIDSLAYPEYIRPVQPSLVGQIHWSQEFGGECSLQVWEQMRFRNAVLAVLVEGSRDPKMMRILESVEESHRLTGKEVFYEYDPNEPPGIKFPPAGKKLPPRTFKSAINYADVRTYPEYLKNGLVAVLQELGGPGMLPPRALANLPSRWEDLFEERKFTNASAFRLVLPEVLAPTYEEALQPDFMDSYYKPQSKDFKMDLPVGELKARLGELPESLRTANLLSDLPPEVVSNLKDTDSVVKSSDEMEIESLDLFIEREAGNEPESDYHKYLKTLSNQVQDPMLIFPGVPSDPEVSNLMYESKGTGGKPVTQRSLSQFAEGLLNHLDGVPAPRQHATSLAIQTKPVRGFESPLLTFPELERECPATIEYFVPDKDQEHMAAFLPTGQAFPDTIQTFHHSPLSPLPFPMLAYVHWQWWMALIGLLTPRFLSMFDMRQLQVKRGDLFPSRMLQPGRNPHRIRRARGFGPDGTLAMSQMRHWLVMYPLRKVYVICYRFQWNWRYSSDKIEQWITTFRRAPIKWKKRRDLVKGLWRYLNFFVFDLVVMFFQVLLWIPFVVVGDLLALAVQGIRMGPRNILYFVTHLHLVRSADPCVFLLVGANTSAKNLLVKSVAGDTGVNIISLHAQDLVLRRRMTVGERTRIMTDELVKRMKKASTLAYTNQADATDTKVNVMEANVDKEIARVRDSVLGNDAHGIYGADRKIIKDTGEYLLADRLDSDWVFDDRSTNLFIRFLSTGGRLTRASILVLDNLEALYMAQYCGFEGMKAFRMYKSLLERMEQSVFRNDVYVNLARTTQFLKVADRLENTFGITVFLTLPSVQGRCDILHSYVDGFFLPPATNVSQSVLSLAKQLPRAPHSYVDWVGSQLRKSLALSHPGDPLKNWQFTKRTALPSGHSFSAQKVQSAYSQWEQRGILPADPWVSQELSKRQQFGGGSCVDQPIRPPQSTFTLPTRGGQYLAPDMTEDEWVWKRSRLLRVRWDEYDHAIPTEPWKQNAQVEMGFEEARWQQTHYGHLAEYTSNRPIPSAPVAAPLKPLEIVIRPFRLTVPGMQGWQWESPAVRLQLWSPTPPK